MKQPIHQFLKKTTLLIFCSYWLVSWAHAETQPARDAEELFNSFCFSCHGTGWEDAPVLGDTYAWEERLEKGINQLLTNTEQGYNSMPPKGGCSNCTTDELKSIVIWMSE